ncbi:hypothetical protein Hanom_Chr09g00830331 [Helianthus anomalus]
MMLRTYLQRGTWYRFALPDSTCYELQQTQCLSPLDFKTKFYYTWSNTSQVYHHVFLIVC